MAPKQKRVAEIGYVQRRNGRFRPVHGLAAAEHVQPADAEPGINIVLLAKETVVAMDGHCGKRAKKTPGWTNQQEDSDSDNWGEWRAPAAEQRQPPLESCASSEEHWDRPAAAADVATLQRQATQRMNAALPTSIIHAFLDYLPLTDDHAAARVTEVLDDETKLSDDDLAAIASVFEPAFIWYTDPRQRTEFVNRDTLSYVRAWQELASHRSAVGKTAYFDGTILTSAQRQTCFQAYLRDFGSTPLRAGQHKRHMKSYAEAHLREIAANRLIACVIWEVGVPFIAPAAEQRADPLDENIIAILEWLDGAARSISKYQQTVTYQDAVRRAGPSHGVSGLTQEEQAQRSQLRRAHANVRKGRKLAELWDQRLITYATVADADWAVLQKHWDGSDVQHLQEIQQQRGDRRIKMPELWTHP